MRQSVLLRFALRRLAGCLALALAGALAWGSAVASSAEEGGWSRHAVKDPHFGDSLFYFYQERYFTALTTLMVSQHFGRVAHHADEAEVLRGGLYLSYGLHREAAEVFARLIEKGAPPSVRDRAWYYLAKIRYQRGFLAEAQDALDRIKGRLPADLEEDRWLLRANVLMARGDYAGASQSLKPLATQGKAALYARYNLGIALIKSDQVAEGSQVLDAIGVGPAASEEFLSLRDKANVALGFTALQDKHPDQARVYLERVRLSGMLANKALLGFGWAADALSRPSDALVPWSELTGRDASDAAVLEAKLAVPYALAEMGAYSQALEQYRDAISTFDHENVSLDESIAAIRSGKLLDGLLASNPGEEMGWFWNIDKLPDLPHARHLVEVLALHEFQEAFKSYRDLQFLAKNLRDWQGNLGVMKDMLANRRQAFAERLPQVQEAARNIGISNLEQRRDSLKSELALAEGQADGLAFADAKERSLLVRLDRARAALEREHNDPQSDVARERYRRVAGALSWQLAQEFPTRLWDAKKDLTQLTADLARARSLDADLMRAQKEEPAHFDQFAARISALEQRIRALIPRVEELLGLQRGAVQEMAVAELQAQKERLALYGTQARFAVAQIYDRARLAKVPENATEQ